MCDKLLSFLLPFLKTIDKVKFWCNRPVLKIVAFDNKVWKGITPDGKRAWIRKCVTAQIKNIGKTNAKRCVAVVKILKCPNDKEFSLHWADMPYSLKSTGAEPVEIQSQVPQRLDIAFTVGEERTITEGLSPGLSPENVFANGQILQGCWIAIPIALSVPSVSNQAYLPPGEYEMEVATSCENGKGDKKKIQIISPTFWKNLQVKELQ